MKHANAKILIADDEKAITAGLGAILGDEGYGIEIAEDGQKALDRLAADKFGVVLADLKMPKLDGIALLKAIRERKIPTEFIMITGQGSTELAIEAIKQGAVDYIEKPLNTERLNKLKAQIPKLLDQFALQEKNRELTARLEGLTHYGELTGQSESLRAVYQVIDAVAPSSASASAPRARSSPSTARPSRRRFSRTSSSATRRAPSLARRTRSPAPSRCRAAVPSSSTKSPRWLRTSR